MAYNFQYESLIAMLSVGNCLGFRELLELEANSYFLFCNYLYFEVIKVLSSPEVVFVLISLTAEKESYK